MRYKKFVMGLLLVLLPAVLIGVSGTQTEATIDGAAKSDSYQAIVFPQIKCYADSADTLESVKCWSLHKEISYFIKVTSFNNGGWSSDTVYVRLCDSADDSTFSNVSSINETKTLTAEGTWKITFDYLGSSPFTRLEIPRITDSTIVDIKAIISPREGVR